MAKLSSVDISQPTIQISTIKTIGNSGEELGFAQLETFFAMTHLINANEFSIIAIDSSYNVKELGENGSESTIYTDIMEIDTDVKKNVHCIELIGNFACVYIKEATPPNIKLIYMSLMMD